MSITLNVLDPPLRVMSLHALLYCPRLFYLEEVEEIRLADDRVYAGRELHTALEAENEGEWVSVEVESDRLGLKGKIDCLKRRDGLLIPYEHKRGRCMRGNAGCTGLSREACGGPGPTAASDETSNASAGSTDGHLAWPSDRVQAAAYALLLADATGQSIPEARVRYHTDNVTVRVPIDDAAHAEVLAAIAEARRLRASLERPPVTDNERLCARCSLAPVCLPEEVRSFHHPGRATPRLFPAEDGRTVLHVITAGAGIGRAGDTLVVRPPPSRPDLPETKHPAASIGSLVLHGAVQLTAQALGLCVARDINVHWLSGGGRYLAALAPGAGKVQRRIRQFKALSNPCTCFRLASALVQAKVQGQHRYLLRATRGKPLAREAVDSLLRRIAHTLADLARAANPDILRGYEGEAGRYYFAALTHLIGGDVPDALRPSGRSRRPPLDAFNAILSFGYSLLHAAVMRSVLAVGLEPALGFYHRPGSAAHPLVLDLMELFRLPLWDVVVIGSLNRGQWRLKEDFVTTRTKVWLSEDGRRKAIGLFEERLQGHWKHPVLGYSLSYARTIELEARLLEKEWTGEPGLFARSRIR